MFMRQNKLLQRSADCHLCKMCYGPFRLGAFNTVAGGRLLHFSSDRKFSKLLHNSGT